MNHLPKRKRIRLKNFDYSSANYYYVTICTFNKRHLFGMNDKLTFFGKILNNQINELNNQYYNVSVDKYVIMPNHIHMIIVVSNNAGQAFMLAEDSPMLQEKPETARKNPCPTLGNIVGAFKAGVTREIRKHDKEIVVWQPRFYDHIIKNDADYENVWTYIDENPVKWEDDEYY